MVGNIIYYTYRFSFTLLLCLHLNYIQSQNLTNTTNISITKVWSQEPNGFTYPMYISVPQGNPPLNGFPIAILLHGNGGNGNNTIINFQNTLSCHVLIAPTGYQNSWNICSENSDAPDTEMVEELVTQLQSYSNINPNKIRIVGLSNGAALANNIFIQNTNPGIDIICAAVSQLNEPQYHQNNFWKPTSNTDPSSNNCGYNTQAFPILNRKYLSICNDNDMTIPYYGGPSPVGLNFIHAEEAAYVIAKNNGYLGPKIDSAAGFPLGLPVVFEYAYPTAGVFHIRGNAGHGMNNTQHNYIKDFLNDCSSTTELETNKSNELIVFPNPSSSMVTIKHPYLLPAHLKIYDALGKLVEEIQTVENQISIDLSKFSDKFYYLKVGNNMIKITKI